MKQLTKGVVNRDQAKAISSEYVDFIEKTIICNRPQLIDQILDQFATIQRGQKVLTYAYLTKQFVIAKVTSTNSNSFRAVDGPIVRVGNGEATWRVDGSGYAIPIN